MLLWAKGAQGIDPPFDPGIGRFQEGYRMRWEKQGSSQIPAVPKAVRGAALSHRQVGTRARLLGTLGTACKFQRPDTYWALLNEAWAGG